MIVAFVVPHNEGIIRGLITGPGFNVGTELTDLYEVDASMTSHATVEEAEAWLVDESTDDEQDMPFKRTNVRGGYIESVRY